MSNTEFISKLSEHIKFVFDHEQEFVIEFLGEFAGCEIEAFYMASERCRVNVIDMESGAEYETTIRTDAFINWVDKLKNENSASA